MNTTRQILTEKHSFIQDTKFRVKSALLTAKRLTENLFSNLKVYKDAQKLVALPVIALSESDLWNPYDNDDNWILTAGKIENIRIAARKLNGIEVKANEVFSFWKHIGNPNFGKGYVVGREVREGCIVPTIAGGLCQMSNALYDAALKANFEIVERHRHTRVIKGSLAEQDRDATVKWNYVDLRFRSDYDFRIEVELTSEKLIVRFKSTQKNLSAQTSENIRDYNKLNDCYSCGNTSCFKHPGKPTIKRSGNITTFILDEKWPEYDAYINSIATQNDFYILPLAGIKLLNAERYSWSLKNHKHVRSTLIPGVLRALKQRIASKTGKNIFEITLNADRKIAERAAQMIPVESAHIVVSQNLLPFLFTTGALGGRAYDVLMTRLPMEKLHERLDHAFNRYPESRTLKDYRASQPIIDLENRALTMSHKIITPHHNIADIFRNKAIQLDWSLPDIRPAESIGTKILFPSSLGRKGAYEVKKLAMELNLSIVIAGRAAEQDDFWKGIVTERFNGNFKEIGLVVYPAYVEHQPRLILKAISKGIPVITTRACGIEPTNQVKVLEAGDYEGFKREVMEWYSLQNKYNI
ncbi:VanW family protein [Sporocytophaga myxococcoides]|uniref:VanW family protein n=1 Tax=Sporocytophaga myxococcoides TaxID=153721 RepID=UPI0003FFD487|nr:VanW family protein [Sporocytophaga myxococcoides]